MEFKPAQTHLVMDRDFYNKVKSDLEKMKFAINIQEARERADMLLDRLKNKFENSLTNQTKVKSAIVQSDAKIGISHREDE